MAPELPDLDRRTVLQGLGATAATAAVGGLGAVSLTGGATATAGSSIADPDAVTSDDGKITYVAVQATGRLTWDGFDEPARYARITTRVRYKRDGSTLWSGTIHDTGKFDLSGSWGGAGEATSRTGDHEAGQAGYIASDIDWGIAQANRNNTYNDGYGLPNNPAPTDYLYADSDGATQKTRVVLESEYRLYASDGAELTGTSGYPDRPTHSSDFVVTVTNQAATTGTGDDDAEGDTSDSATVGV